MCLSLIIGILLIVINIIGLNKEKKDFKSILVKKKIYMKKNQFLNFLFDRKIFIGIGIGMIISTFIIIGTKRDLNYDKATIEQKARGMGMEYPVEMRVLPNKEVEKNK